MLIIYLLYIGPCTKIHDEKLKKQYVLYLEKFIRLFSIGFHHLVLFRYNEAPDRAKYGYEIKFYDYLQSLCNDLDKKIRKGNDRLNVRPDDTVRE